MFQIGESLREARTRRGLSPADVHKAIRIRERYLTALEEERWHMLPGEAYVRGFLKTYADFLGLDGNLYLDEYSARLRPLADEPFVALPAPARRHGRLPARALAALAALVVTAAVVAGLAAWLGGSSSPRHATPPPPAHAKKIVSAQPPPAKHAAPKGPAFASFSAAHGRCWLLIRDGGPNGPVLWQGTLEPGQAKRFRLNPRLWVRLGAPSALDLRVAGRRVPGLPDVPENLLLTRTGAQPSA